MRYRICEEFMAGSTSSGNDCIVMLYSNQTSGPQSAGVETLMQARLLILLTGMLVCPLGAAFAGPSAPVSVPEPASLGLLATGAGALIIYHWRRKK